MNAALPSEALCLLTGAAAFAAVVCKASAGVGKTFAGETPSGAVTHRLAFAQTHGGSHSRWLFH
jgi:hypothetical protein